MQAHLVLIVPANAFDDINLSRIRPIRTKYPDWKGQKTSELRKLCYHLQAGHTLTKPYSQCLILQIWVVEDSSHVPAH